MKKILILTLSIATLAGCTPEERAEQRQLIQRQLPKGCQMYDLGPYAEFERLVAVTCPGTVTTTQGLDKRQSGKTRLTYQYAIIR